MAREPIRAESIWVECCADVSGEVPTRFGRGEATQDVAEVLDRWPGKGHCYFKVRTRDGAIFILRHDEAADSWEISVYRKD